MIKFEIKENTREISYKNRSEIKAGCTLDQVDQEPVIVKSFNSKDEALEALNDYKTGIEELSDRAGTYYSVTEYYVEENEYDERGEWIGGGNVWGFSKMQIEVVKELSYETIGIFDNDADSVN